MPQIVVSKKRPLSKNDSVILSLSKERFGLSGGGARAMEGGPN
jgi:hypothetical protein